MRNTTKFVLPDTGSVRLELHEEEVFNIKGNDIIVSTDDGILSRCVEYFKSEILIRFNSNESN